jgi:uncharacterized protein (DUF1800 family)
MANLAQIDADWAWSEYVPDAANPWTRSKAAHLFRRAGFAATSEQLDEAAANGPQHAVSQLMDTATEPPHYQQQIESLASASLASGDVHNLSAWWAYRMLTTPDQLQEKLTLFWHGHFATSAAKVTDGKLMLAQNQLLREFALGDFSQLALEISQDPAMLIYLDSATNRKAHPNENFAREIMELFVLGEGNYSETDIRELARCFTGWEIKRDKFRFNRYQHDFDQKTILGRTGKFSGEEGVEIVVQQRAAPLFLAGKLVRFFVMDELQNEALLQPLAETMTNSGMLIKPLVRKILSSQLFFSPHAIGRKIRSPVEFAIGFLRATAGSTDTYELAAALELLGQGLFYPPSVKGWDGGRTWINSSTLLGRSNLIHKLLTSDKTRFDKTTLADFMADQQATSADDIINWFEAQLFAIPIPDTARRQITQLFTAHTGNSADRITETVHALCALPEFQLG